MLKKLAALLLVFNCALSRAQTLKTDVLVIGGSAGGVAAAIQSARSRVKTILIESAAQLCPNMADGTVVTVKADRNLPSGIWGEFRRRVMAHYLGTAGYDTSYNAPLQFAQEAGAVTLSGIADTVKNLQIKVNTQFQSIIKDGDRWDVITTQKGKAETIKARVVVDATETGEVMQKTNAFYNWHADEENYYRTSIAMGATSPPLQTQQTDGPYFNYPLYPAYAIPLKAIIATGADNLLVTQKVFRLNGDMEYLPAQLTLGQGVGVTAAYLAFFKTTTANLNVRMIQGELLNFKGYILPFEDITHDAYWRAIQQVCATGILKGVQKNIGGDREFLFVPDSVVNTAEVKPVLLELYARAFLWFAREKPGAQFTLGNLLSFISELTLTEPDNLRKRIGKAWKAEYHFTSDFNPSAPLSRREFAILANAYLNPFSRAVDLDGREVN